MMTPADFLIRMLIALLGGMLIGLERERAQASSITREKGSIPGLRSFGLLSLFGGLIGYLSMAQGDQRVDVSLVAVSYLALSALVILYAYSRMVKRGVSGITTYIVMFTTFVIGFLSGIGLVLESAASSVIVTLVLALKNPAERIAMTLNYDELLAMLEVAALALVFGPLIQSYAEQSGLSIVFKIYLFFTIILMISFASYMTAKAWGAKGLFYAALLGSLVNSEATASSTALVVSRIGNLVDRKRLLGSLIPLIIATAQAKLAILGIIGTYLFADIIYGDVVLAGLLIVLVAVVIGYISAAKTSTYTSTLQQVEIQSPLSWSTALKGAVAYGVLTGLFFILPKTSIGSWYGMPLLLSFIGGLVNATAVILSIGTSVASLTHCQIISSILLTISAASINKILYINTTRLSKEEFKTIIAWSIIMSLVPIIILLTVASNCF